MPWPAAVRNLALAGLALALLLTPALPAGADTGRVDLTELSLEDLLDVQVTLVTRRPQRLSHTPAAATVLSGDEVRRSGARTLADALRLVPGLQVARVDANKWVVTSRGFAGLFANKLLVLVDGRSVYTPMFSGVFWESQDVVLADVERIEVIRGPGGSLWGANAVNGIVNVVTRPAADSQGTHATVGGGTEERAFAALRHGGRLGRAGHYRVYGKAQARDRSAPAGQLAVRDDWRTARAGARLDLPLGAADQLSVQVEASGSDVGQGLRYVTGPAPPYYGTRYFDARVRAGHLLANWSRRLAAERHLAVQVYGDYFDRRELPIRGTIRTLDADVQHSAGWGPRGQLVCGAGYRRIADEYEGSFTMRLVPEQRTVHLWSAFAHGEVAPLSERLRLSVGTKAEHNSYTGLEWQPNARLWWSPADDHGLWVSAARAVRTPSRADHGLRAVLGVLGDSLLAVLRGDESFGSEHVVAFEAGYRGTLSRSLSVDAAAHRTYYDHLLTNEPLFAERDLSLSPPQMPLAMANLGEATSHGLEAALEWRGGDRWRLRGWYTYLALDVSLKPGSLDATTVSYEGESPTHQLGAHAMADLTRGVQLDVLARLVGAVENHDLDRYVTADARLSAPVASGARLVLVGQNLLRRRHRELASAFSGTIPAAVQRGAYAALEWDL